jgi:hypothetical protein
MQCQSLIYSNNVKLKEFIQTNRFESCSNILIQIFTGINDYAFIHSL